MSRSDMRRTILALLIASAAIVGATAPLVGAGDDTGRAPAAAERRALEFLAREVPQWSRENHCFSCHNNGDATRALLAARQKGVAIPAKALDDTLAFLARPESWDKNGADTGFSDKRLARLQFANALAASVAVGAVNDRSALLRAARRLADDQAPDGSWPMDDGALVGAPATYGLPLATAQARLILAAAGAEEFAGPIAKADRWLLDRPAHNVLDASAILIGLNPQSAAAERRAAACLDLLRKGQAQDGGWGPFVNSPPEVFDTAIALLALARWPDRAAVAPLIERGRMFLVLLQADDGSWPETTRPSGRESYAQRISTAGWATLALLATDP